MAEATANYNADLAATAETLRDLLDRETFFRELAAIDGGRVDGFVADLSSFDDVEALDQHGGVYLAAISDDSEPVRLLPDTSSMAYSASGHLLLMEDDSLVGVRTVGQLIDEARETFPAYQQYGQWLQILLRKHCAQSDHAGTTTSRIPSI